MHWAKDLGASETDLRQANHDSIAFVSDLRDEFPGNAKPIVLDAIVGPRGDAYAPEESVAADQAAAHFMVNCAHPDHFFHVLGDDAWARRIRGIRCNASRQSHEELDISEVPAA
jgi:S-methylmethionine-dependent homocysteine/selenocysteine methylase